MEPIEEKVTDVPVVGEAETPATDADESRTPTVNEPETETEGDKTEDGDEPSDDPADEPGDIDSYVETLADALRTADPSRFDSLSAKFESGETFTRDDIGWIATTTGHDEPSVRYVMSLQRDRYESQKMDQTASIASIEAEVGSLPDLLRFAQMNAPAEMLQTWQTVADFAKRTGDDNMTQGLLREIKAFKDSIPSKASRPKTLGHLGTSQVPTNEPKVEPVTKPSAEDESELAALAAIRNLSTQALAKVASNGQADPASRSRAITVLKQRGVLP